MMFNFVFCLSLTNSNYMTAAFARSSLLLLDNLLVYRLDHGFVLLVHYFHSFWSILLIYFTCKFISLDDSVYHRLSVF